MLHFAQLRSVCCALGIALWLTVLAGCTGGSGVTLPPPGPTPTPTPTPTPAPKPLYVANRFANSITAYAAGANGNVAPSAGISGAATGLNFPEGVALDAAGKIYVANFNPTSITVYAAGATGNVAPSATISGAATGLNGPFGVAF